MATRNIQTREGYEIWDRLCAIPSYGFLLAPEGNRVVAAKGIGHWIDQHAAQVVVDDAQSEINILKEQRDALLAALEKALATAQREGHPFRAWQDEATAAIAAAKGGA